MLLVQQVCSCAHLRIDELLNMWSIPTTSLLVSSSPLDCLYNQTHDLELLRDIKDLQHVGGMSSGHLVISWLG